MISSLRAFLSTFAQQVPVSCLTLDDQLIFESVAQAQFFRQWFYKQHQDKPRPLPEFMSLQTWLKQRYLLQPHTQCTICEHLQQLQIWYNAVIQTPYFADQPTLAWQTARQYQTQYRHEASFFLEEASHDSAYQAARAFYLQCLENKQLTDYTQLARTFSAWHKVVSPHRFFWIGFSVCTPSLRAIITHLPKQKICYLAPTCKNNETIVKPYPVRINKLIIL